MLGLMLTLTMVFVHFFPAHAAVVAHAIPAVGHLFDAHVALAAGSSMTITGSCFSLASYTEEECGSNPGGTVNVYVANKRDVESIPEPDSNSVVVSKPIVMKPGKYFAHWPFAQDTGDINHKSDGEAGNKSITTDLNTYVPRGNPAIDKVINDALNSEQIVIVEDSLGQKRIGGDKRRGLIFDHDYKSGKKGGDKNGTDFKWAASGLGHVPYYYTASVPLAPEATAPETPGGTTGA